MWKDNDDKILNMYKKFINSYEFDQLCPICNTENVHFYMHIHNSISRKGGLWVWCSNCHSYSHCSIIVPKIWKNCVFIESIKLCATPEYLDENKDLVDSHIKSILKTVESVGFGKFV